MFAEIGKTASIICAIKGLFWYKTNPFSDCIRLLFPPQRIDTCILCNLLTKQSTSHSLIILPLPIHTLKPYSKNNHSRNRLLKSLRKQLLELNKSFLLET